MVTRTIPVRVLINIKQSEKKWLAEIHPGLYTVNAAGIVLYKLIEKKCPVTITKGCSTVTNKKSVNDTLYESYY